MSRLIVSEFITLDGVFEAPETWSLEYWDDGIAQFKHDELFESDALLLGRVTYQGFAEAWPERTDETGFADRINSMPKYVVSTTLEDADWNASVVDGNVPESIQELKDQDDGTVLVNGSGELVASLLEHGLVDEYRLLMYPVVLGEGRSLFPKGQPAMLTLDEAKSFDSGAVLLRYKPV